MSVKIIYTLGIIAALTMFTGARAADGGGPMRGGGGGRLAQTLLDHADDLGLTAEQKAKLQDMAKGPMSVLTDEQKTKAKDLMPKRGGPDGERKPKAEGDTAKKPDEKKPEETK